MPRSLTNTDLPTQQDTGAKSKGIKIIKDKLNVRYKGIQTTIDKNTKKRIDQVARKTIRSQRRLRIREHSNKNNKSTNRRKNSYIYTTHRLGANIRKRTKTTKKIAVLHLSQTL